MLDCWRTAATPHSMLVCTDPSATQAYEDGGFPMLFSFPQVNTELSDKLDDVYAYQDMQDMDAHTAADRKVARCTDQGSKEQGRQWHAFRYQAYCRRSWTLLWDARAAHCAACASTTTAAASTAASASAVVKQQPSEYETCFWRTLTYRQPTKLHLVACSSLNDWPSRGRGLEAMVLMGPDAVHAALQQWSRFQPDWLWLPPESSVAQQKWVRECFEWAANPKRGNCWLVINLRARSFDPKRWLMAYQPPCPPRPCASTSSLS